jgi:hypothetical protein
MKKKLARRASRSAPDALALLKADHKTVSGLFERFEHGRSSTVKHERSAAIVQGV